MKKYLLSVVFIFAASAYAVSQTDIEFDIKHYESDTIILGYYLADRILIKDSLLRSEETGTFRYTQDSLMEPGMYLMVSVPEGLFYQILVGQEEEEQQFKVTIDTTAEIELIPEGSIENALFYEYLEFVEAARVEQSRLDQVIMDTDSVMQSIRLQLLQDKEAIKGLVVQKQKQIVEEHPNRVAALLLKSNLPFDFPDFVGSPEEIQQQRYKHYKKHYFDEIGFKHPALLRTPVMDQRVNYYLDNLTPLEPDSTIVSVDYLLGEMDQEGEMYRYYLSHFLNKYGNSQYIGFDAVYVHLALNYYGKDKAPWITEDNKKEIVANAKKIAPILIGKQAPDFTIYKENGDEITLSELDNEYTVLLFWKPGCGHCAKAIPHVLEFQEKYKDQDVEVITICTKRGKEFDSCWEDVKKKGMDSLINAGDPTGKSRILSNYYATSTPKIFIIDRDQKIKLKKVPAENLDAVLQQLMEIDAAEKGVQGE